MERSLDQPRRRLPNILLPSIGIGLICAAVSLTSVGNYMEEEWGLKVLFRLRGIRPAPDKVALVSLDRNTADKFDLPAEPERWPRKLYADLIRYLTEKGAAVIAIDVLFNELRSSAEDQQLAEAIGDSGRVILVSDMKRDTVPIDGESGEAVGAITLESVVPPHSILAERALGIAPFPIPKDLSLAKQFWLYTDNNPHLVTFPALTLSAYMLRTAASSNQSLVPALSDWLGPQAQAVRDDGELHRMVAAVADGMENIPNPTSRWDEDVASASVGKEGGDTMDAWLASFRLGAAVHFNHYGPPGTIPTISVSRLLQVDKEASFDFRGKAVFVGYAEDLQPQQNHGFFTYFSNSASDAVSSAELAAEAFGNLLDRSAIQPLPRFSAPVIALSWSLLFGLVAMRRLTTMRFAVLAGLWLTYLGVAYWQFRDEAVWLPFVMPLWVASPLILLTAATGQYLHTRRERQQIYSAFRHYIPESVVDRLIAEGIGPSANQGIAIDEGICLSTDAGQYTRIAERMDPMALADLMNRYYGVVFPAVTGNGGFISDVVGDAVMALWVENVGRREQCTAVCRSALGMSHAVADFGRRHGLQIPIRVGVNAGPFRLGNVGSADRLEYRATGDTVNTASRIENLCKRLGCGILVADSVIRHAEGFLTRRLGAFLLEGKSIPIVVHELMAHDDDASDDQRQLAGHFQEAEGRYGTGDLKKALALFEAILETWPEDGPSQFYISHIQGLLHLPADARRYPVIAVGKT